MMVKYYSYFICLTLKKFSKINYFQGQFGSQTYFKGYVTQSIFTSCGRDNLQFFHVQVLKISNLTLKTTMKITLFYEQSMKYYNLFLIIIYKEPKTKGFVNILKGVLYRINGYLPPVKATLTGQQRLVSNATLTLSLSVRHVN